MARASTPSAASAFEFKATLAARRALRSVGNEEGAAVHVVLADGRPVDLPKRLAAVLLNAVREVAGGHDVALVSLDDEVSPAKAGELLGLSRQYVDRLIAGGVLPARRLPRSTHRRLRVSDVLAFADLRDKRRKLITDMVDTLTEAGAEY